jgi:hypothetical protein
MGLLDDAQEYARRSGRNLAAGGEGLLQWLSGGAQAGAEPIMGLLRGDAADEPLLPTANSGGRIGAVASALGSTILPVGAPAGALGAGPVVKMASEVDPMRAGKVRMIDPASLEFREQMQNNTAEIGRMFPPNKAMPPIVTTVEDGVETILDGHNRTAVALDRGYTELPAVALSAKQYQSLIDAGFDDAEISYAALMRAGKKAAAAGIDKKFPGAGVARRGADAFATLKKTPFE